MIMIEKEKFSWFFFQKLRNHLKQSTDVKPWLIHFVDQTNNDKDLDLRKLPSMLTGKYYYWKEIHQNKIDD